MCLKPSLLLWLAIFFLSRAITLPVVIGIGHIAGVNGDAMTMLRDFWNEDQLVPAAFSCPVLYACVRRVPTAADAVRWIWARARILLSIAASLDIVLSVVRPLWHHEIGGQLAGAVISGLVDVYFLAYILSARRVRDTFLDFPPPLASKKVPSTRA